MSERCLLCSETANESSHNDSRLSRAGVVYLMCIKSIAVEDRYVSTGQKYMYVIYTLFQTINKLLTLLTPSLYTTTNSIIAYTNF